MWKKPEIKEVAVGLEINSYACAVKQEFKKKVANPYLSLNLFKNDYAKKSSDPALKNSKYTVEQDIEIKDSKGVVMYLRAGTYDLSGFNNTSKGGKKYVRITLGPEFKKSEPEGSGGSTPPQDIPF